MITLLLLLLLPKTFLSLYGGKETPCECLPKSYHKPKDKDHVSQIVDHAEFCAPETLDTWICDIFNILQHAEGQWTYDSAWKNKTT